MIWDVLKRVFARRNGRHRALVVEDDPAFLALIRNHLKTAGVKSTASDSCDEALELATQTPERFSLFIFKKMVNGQSGFELARQIRMARGMAQIPILFLLDRGTEEELARLKRTFAHTQAMTKPFSGLQFVEGVKTALQTQRRRRPIAKSSLRCKTPPPARMRAREFDV